MPGRLKLKSGGTTTFLYLMYTSEAGTVSDLLLAHYRLMTQNAVLMVAST